MRMQFDDVQETNLRSRGCWRVVQKCLGKEKAMNCKLNLNQGLLYQIKVSGQLSVNWCDWMEDMVIEVEGRGHQPPVTTISGIIDQTALQRLLCKVYSLGFPLLSVRCLDPDVEKIA